MTDAKRLAHALLARMKEIESNRDQEDEERYGLLWDAIVDEIKAVCPDIDYITALGDTTLQTNALRAAGDEVKAGKSMNTDAEIISSDQERKP